MLVAAWVPAAHPLEKALLMLAYLHQVRHPLRLDRDVLRHLRLDWKLLKTLLKIGVPTGVQMIMVSLSEIAIVSLVNRFGSSATAAYGAYYQVANYVQMPAISLGIAVSIFGAQAIGAGRFDRLRRVIRAGIALNFVVGGVLVVLCYLFATNILSWATPFLNGIVPNWPENPKGAELSTPFRPKQSAEFLIAKNSSSGAIICG